MIGKLFEESVYVTLFRNAQGGRISVFPIDPEGKDIRDNRLKFFANEQQNAIICEIDSKGVWWTIDVRR